MSSLELTPISAVASELSFDPVVTKSLVDVEEASIDPWSEGLNLSVGMDARTRNLVADILLGDDDNITSAAMHCLGKCPIDCRRVVISHVVVIGGGSLFPGLRHRLTRQMKRAAEETASTDLSLSRCVSESLWVPESPFPSNMLAWVGGSIFSLSEFATSLTISKEAFQSALKTNAPHAVSILPDWLFGSGQRHWPVPNTVRCNVSLAHSIEAKGGEWARDRDGIWSRKKEKAAPTRNPRDSWRSDKVAIAASGIGSLIEV